MRLEQYTQAAEAASAIAERLDRVMAGTPSDTQMSVDAPVHSWRALLDYVEELAEAVATR